MADPRTSLATFSLALGIDNVSAEENVQPMGARPRLVRSRNTRLTKVPGMVAKAPGCTQLASGLTAPCGGLVPSGALDSSLLLLDPVTASRRIADDDVGVSNGIYAFGQPKSSYYPAQVVNAGTVPGVQRSYYNSCCAYVESAGQTWFAALVPRGSTSCAIVVTVIDDAGRVVVAQTFVGDAFGLGVLADSKDNFLGISAHGSTVILWRGFGGAGGGISAAHLTLTGGLQLTLGAWVGIFGPVATNGYARTQIAYDAADTANVYLTCQHNVTANNQVVLRIDTATLAIAAPYTYVGALAITNVGLAYRAGDAVILGLSVGSWTLVELTPALVFTAVSNFASGINGPVGVGFQTFQATNPGVVYRVLAVTGLSAGIRGTYVECRAPGTLALVYSENIPFQILVGQIATQTNSPTDIHALITTQICYDQSSNVNTYNPLSSAFVFDPSIEVLRLHVGAKETGPLRLLFYPIARLGTDIVVRYPGPSSAVNAMFISSSNSVIAHGSRVLVTYLGENIEEGLTPYGFLTRYAWLELGNVQPSFAPTGIGETVIAGALPAVWDGSQVTELSPMRLPTIVATTLVGGSGPVFPAGTFRFAAVVHYKDAQGQIHRSAPSNPVTLVNPTQPTLIVSAPITHRNGATQELFTITIYASYANGVVLYAQSMLSSAGIYGETFRTWTFNTIPLPVVDAFHPALYTDGSATQPLPAFMPNACLDADVVANRLWLLDAERPLRWWFSKPREIGVFFEMSPDLFVDVPSNAGRGVATSNLRETPLFLCSNGLWTVAGEGPDALLNPPDYSAPQQLSDTSCTQRNSVVKTPVGVMFVSADRFVLFQGAIKEFSDVDALLHGPIVGTAVFRKAQEVVFFCADGFCYVYNWAVDAFTEWDQAVTGVTSITAVAQVPASGKVLYYGDAGELWLMDSDSVSQTAQIDILTGLITFGGAQDDQVIANVLMHAKRAGAHGLAVKTATDYRGTFDSTKAYSAADIASAVDDTTTSKRYALFAEPTVQQARAVQLQFTETGAVGEAFQPIHCTVELRKNPGKLMLAMRTAARR